MKPIQDTDVVTDLTLPLDGFNLMVKGIKISFEPAADVIEIMDVVLRACVHPGTKIIHVNH